MLEGVLGKNTIPIGIRTPYWPSEIQHPIWNEFAIEEQIMKIIEICINPLLKFVVTASNMKQEWGSPQLWRRPAVKRVTDKALKF